MKKFTLTLGTLLLTALSFAQIGSKNSTISANIDYSDPNILGLVYEFGYENFSIYSGFSSNILKVSATQMNYKYNSDLDVKGTGYAIELGSRGYARRGFEGNYVEWMLSYGSTSFNNTTITMPDGTSFEGTYSYFSFVNPSFGYKVMFGGLSIDPSLGFTWKIEIKGKGDVDNINVDTTSFKAGLRIGYSF